MELVGFHQAQRVLNNDQLALESMQIDYLSTPPSDGSVEIQCEILSQGATRLSLLVSLVSKGRVCSQGTLCFSVK